ncbi:MAG TPA: Gfo/Idh/MocA family oxidoreductase [Capsulimonadaceae bacterium]|jgi:predicted dehydrogenase
MVNVGIIGLGGMGRVHYNCYLNNPQAKIVALCDIDQRKLDGDWSAISLNIDTSKTPLVDLGDAKKYLSYADLLADPNIDMVDICLPTPLHAPVAIAAMKAGKHVLCEKPMARQSSQAEEMIATAKETGKQLMIAQCLRYWGQYVSAGEIIKSGRYGKVLYASFSRAGGTPMTAWNNWYLDGQMSGGVILDMHIHDVDAALWWFGKPDSITATGYSRGGHPALVDATWTYNGGPLVYLHSHWDANQPSFAYTFHVIMEHASLSIDSSKDEGLHLYTAEGGHSQVELTPESAYQNEVNDFVDAVATGRKLTRVLPESSALSIEVALEEIRQIG